MTDSQKPTKTPVEDAWRDLMLLEMGRMNKAVEALDGRLRNFEQRVAVLEVKAGVWGLIGGALVVGISALVGKFGG